MKFDFEQFSAINAAVANLVRAYHDKPEVPQGALDKYAKQAGARSFSVTHRNGMRVLSINNGLIEIEVGPQPSPAQPTSPTSGAGEVVEFELKKAA